MTTTTIDRTPAGAPATSPRRRSRFVRLFRIHRRSLLILAPLLAIAGVAQAFNDARYPMHIDDEGTYVAQAYAVLKYGALGHYTYWYDHPPLGWLQMAGYAGLTDAFGRYSDAVLAGREFMLVVQLVACALLWVLCRRLLMARWSSTLAVLIFALSPLAVQFHRTVYLDNIATPWLIAAFALALSPQKRLSAFVGSAVCFSIAVLTKETSLLLLPGVAVILWRGTRGSGCRRYALTLSAATFVLGIAAYVLYAVIKGELLPGPGHVSLWGGVKFQLFSRTSSGSVFTPGTLGYQHLHEWLDLDPVTPALAVAATVVGLFSRRLRPIAITFAVLLLLILKPGYLPVPYVIAMLPFAAVLVAGVADVGAHWRPASWKVRPVGRRSVRRVAPLLPAVTLVTVAALIAGGLTWVPKLRGEFRSDPDVTVADSLAWVERNVPHTDRLATDDAYWVDLVRAGFPRDNVVWYYKMDTDPAVERLSPDGWRDYSFLILTQSVRSDPQGLATLQTAIDHSVPVANFGTGLTAVQVRRVLPGGTSQVAQLRSDDRADRLSAGTDLLRNPRLRAAGTARAAIAGGQLDMRAATMLAVLDQQASVTVRDVNVDPAESAAGYPARSVVLAGTSAFAARAVLAGLPSNDRGATVRSVPGGGVRVTWPLAPVPAGSNF